MARKPRSLKTKKDQKLGDHRDKIARYARELLYHVMASLGGVSLVRKDPRNTGFSHWKNFDFLLWGLVLDVPGQRFLFIQIEDKAVEQLRELSRDAKGWWRWSNSNGNVEFVSMREWKHAYADEVEKVGFKVKKTEIRKAPEPVNPARVKKRVDLRYREALAALQSLRGFSR